MKRLLIVFALAACSDNSSSAKAKAKADSAVIKIDSTAKAVWDSTKQGVKDIKKNLDSTFRKKKFKDINH